jgi:glycosyltransferase involved in cell wall biosynthesis
MQCPQLHELPAPPPGKTGWPWTEGSRQLAEPLPGHGPWPRLTVITPSLNQGQFIEATIRSVLLQGYPNLEYLVLDGGSTDNSVEVIEQYSPWITHWVSEPDGGQSTAITRGLTMGSGLFATWINSDDMLYQNALVEHASRVGFVPNTVYVGMCAYMDAAGTVVGMHRGRIHALEDLVHVSKVWRAGGHLVQPEVLFPRELALALGGLNRSNQYTMDYELWGKFFLAGTHFQYTDIPFGMFRLHASQKTANRWRHTQAVLKTAAQLVASATCLSEEKKNEILAELEAYGREYSKRIWRGSGRLARTGLPPNIVTRLRQSRVRLQQLKDRLRWILRACKTAAGC